MNWPYGFPADATAPNGGKPIVDDPPDSPHSTSCPGCRIEAQSQTLGEDIDLTGTAHDLHYRSDWARGYKGAHTLTIPLSGGSVPASLSYIELNISVAGQWFTRRFPASPNQEYVFTWDGKDTYSRDVNGEQPIAVRIGFTYQAVYRGFRTASGNVIKLSFHTGRL